MISPFDTYKQQLKNEYKDDQDRFNAFAQEVESIFFKLLGEQSIELAVPLKQRVKTWESIEQKFERFPQLSKEISQVTELRDLIGIRLILSFERDVERACRVINNFVVTRQEDKADILSPEEFGYRSRHFVVKIPDDWLKHPSASGFADLCCEVQVRTVAQHLWANASRILQYKTEDSVPLHLRRSIHRISALLELVDIEFERILENREEYRLKLERTALQESLNVDSLRQFLQEYLPQNPREFYAKDYDYLRQQLTECRITNIKDLKVVLDRTYEINRKEEIRLENHFKENEKEIGDPAEEAKFTRIDWVLYSLKALNLKPNSKI